MDSLHTATQQTTSVDPFDEYKVLYSEFIPMIIDLHNYHSAFLAFKSIRKRPGLRLRNHLREMRVLLKKLVEECNASEKKYKASNVAVKGRPLSPTTKYKRRKKKTNDMDVSKPTGNGTP